MPEPDHVTTLIGDQFAVSYEQAAAAISVVTAMAKAYTRGVGFSTVVVQPADDDHEAVTREVVHEEIAAVIQTTAIRYLRNPGTLPFREEMGGLVVDIKGGFTGWSIAERAVLDRYRLKAK